VLERINSGADAPRAAVHDAMPTMTAIATCVSRASRLARAREARCDAWKSPVCDARIDDAMADTNRIAKELREIASDTASGVTVSPHGDSLTHMKGTITGA
jgi:hypothetical protein